jgi:K+-sensing histidine kinase KdpD
VIVTRKLTSIEKYAVAIGVVSVAFALRYSLHDTVGNRIPFSFFTLATIIAAWYGGLGPGLLAAVSGLLLGDFFFLPPHSPEGLGETERTGIGVYAMTNTLIVVLFWNLHVKLREAQDELRRHSGGQTESEIGESHAATSGQVRPL